MKKIIAFLPLIFIFTTSVGFSQDEDVLGADDIRKISSYMKDIFDGWIVDDRNKALEGKNKLAKIIDKLEKGKGVGDLLKYTDLWYRISEGAIESNKLFKTKMGKGFQRAEYIDYGQVPEKTYPYFINIPKEYDPEGEVRFPVIIFLHPEITRKGKKVDKEVQKMLKALYSDDEILDQYIIIAPLGPMEKLKPRSRKMVLVDAAKDWESLSGRKTAFTAIRIMREQMVFDRSRVIIEGVGKAGLSAYRYATWYPSFFSGVIGRDAPLAPIVVENLMNIPFLYFSTTENKKNQLEEAKAWADKYPKDGKKDSKNSEEKGEDAEAALRFTLLESAAALNEPSGEDALSEEELEAIDMAAIKAWMGGIKKNTVPREVFMKTADREKAANYWLLIVDLNTGLDVQLDDPDYPWIKGKVESDSNTIVLESKRVLKIMVFLNDKLLDLDKKISIILNGKKRFEGKVERNLDKLLVLSYNNRAGDFELYCNFIEISENE